MDSLCNLVIDVAHTRCPKKKWTFNHVIVSDSVVVFIAKDKV